MDNKGLMELQGVAAAPPPQAVPMQHQPIAMAPGMAQMPPMQQPFGIAPVMVQAVSAPATWEQGRGVCDCCSDLEVCFWGTFFPCCLYGQTKARSGRAADCYNGCLELTGVAVVAVVVQLILDFLVVGALLGTSEPQEPGQIDQTHQGQIDQNHPGSQSPFAGLLMQLPGLVNMVILYGGTGYIAGRVRSSMQAQYGVVAKNLQPAPVGSPPPLVPMDMASFAVHCCPFTHPCALCEEARVVKANTNPNVPMFSDSCCKICLAIVVLEFILSVLFFFGGVFATASSPPQ